MIELNQITKTFLAGSEEVKVLQGIDLLLQRGEFVAIMGTSGAGKSTLLNILGCLDIPSSGSYSFDGQLVHKLSDDQRSAIRRKKVGFVFQSFNLLSDCTVYENVELPFMYGNEDTVLADEQVCAAISRVGLSHRKHYIVKNISGGELQRTAIARAIATAPKVILADEPTGNLDESNTNEILSLFKELHIDYSTSIIMITHDLDVASYADKVLILKEGRLVSM